MLTLGLVANLYNEANALPGWLECHLPFFDDVRVTHAGPQGKHSDDGTIEILEKWDIPVDFDSIDDGFGAVRTRAIRRSPCDYVVLLDVDERFHALSRYLKCSGEDTPHQEADEILRSYDFRDGRVPDWGALRGLGAGLSVAHGGAYDQGARLREVIDHERPLAVCTIRRHWHDLAVRHPTQDWRAKPDWQLRIVKNDPSVYFDPATRMHERMVGVSGVQDIHRADVTYGPFFEHFHFHFKKMEPEQRRHDIAIYDAIHAGQEPPTSV